MFPVHEEGLEDTGFDGFARRDPGRALGEVCAGKFGRDKRHGPDGGADTHDDVAPFQPRPLDLRCDLRIRSTKPIQHDLPINDVAGTDVEECPQGTRRQPEQSPYVTDVPSFTTLEYVDAPALGFMPGSPKNLKWIGYGGELRRLPGSRWLVTSIGTIEHLCDSVLFEPGDGNLQSPFSTQGIKMQVRSRRCIAGAGIPSEKQMKCTAWGSRRPSKGRRMVRSDTHRRLEGRLLAPSIRAIQAIMMSEGLATTSSLAWSDKNPALHQDADRRSE